MVHTLLAYWRSLLVTWLVGLVKALPIASTEESERVVQRSYKNPEESEGLRAVADLVKPSP
jgi:hypothetical protein